MRSFRLFFAALGAIMALLMVTPAVYAQDDAAKSEKVTTRTEQMQPYLGIGVVPLHPALTAHLSDVIGKDRGLLIESIKEDSPAEKAGLKVNDILITFGKQDLYSPEQLVKLVRNADPGQEVTLGYIRAGKVHEAAVKLSEMRVREPDRGRATARIPFEDDLGWVFEQRPDAFERERQNDPKTWATFKSLTITKMDQDQYKAEIEFRDQDDQVLHREYEGTREEIRNAIEEDKSLPDNEREHLLRSLDQQTSSFFRLVPPRSWRDLFNQDSELLNWRDS